MKNSALENLYDRIYFEISTDLAFLASESREIFDQSIDYFTRKISDADQNIEELERHIFMTSEEYKEKWMINLQSLKGKRKDLLIKTKAEFDVQKSRFQNGVEWIEKILADAEQNVS